MAISKWFLCGADSAFEKDEALTWMFAEKAVRKGLLSATFMQTLPFSPGARDDFIGLTCHTKFTDESGVCFEIKAHQVETIGQMKSKWAAYTA
jgi:hypothetical protein